MAVGYDTNQYSPQGAPAQTIEQWVADMAAQYTIAYANGVTSAFDPYPELFADTFWASQGFAPLPKESWGATAKNPNNAVNPGVYSGLVNFFSAMAKNPQLAGSKGLTVPQLPTGGPVTDDLGRQHLYGAEQAKLDREAQLAMQRESNQAALDRQREGDAAAMQRLQAQFGFEGAENEKNRMQQMAIVKLQEAGMDQRQALELANRMSIAQLQDAGESARNAARIAADLQMANQRDATERYGIDKSAETAAADRTSRETIATADRTSREGIATADRAESGRQFDLRLGEDRRQFNSSMILELFDRGIALAKNPVDWIAHQYYMANLSIPLTLLNTTSVANALGAIPPTGPSSLGPMIGGPGAADGDMTAAQAAGVQARMVSLQEALSSNPGAGESWLAPFVAGATAGNLDTQQGMQQIEQILARSRGEAIQEIGDNPVTAQARMEIDRAIASHPPVLPGAQNGQRSPAAALPPIPPAAGTSPSTPAAGGAGNIYTAATSAPTPSGNPQADMIRQLASSLGIDPATFEKLVPTHLLAGQYSPEAIANSPVVKALQSGADRMSQFHTGPGNTKFNTIQAFGTPTGIRGGQDINARLLQSNNPSTIDQIQGLVEAQGLDWRDTVRQSLKAAPTSDFAVGAFGRRRN